MTAERTMLITGASRGIGAATARMAARAGWAVGVNYRSEREAAEALVAEIEAAGGTAAALPADLSSEAEVMALFEAADRLLPPLGCLVNNAGRTAPRPMRLSEVSWEEIATLFAVNVTGAMIASREAAARMSTRAGGGGGAIVNVSSLAAKHGAAALYVHYAASKGALDTFTWGLARELAGEGVRVNGVRPGMIDTEIHVRAGMPDRVEKRGPRLPMGRAGTPDEVAAAILWLASDAASYVTGSILDVGGGA
ncbi:SDR family oxidoreductase [Pikeienuella sp. HZG-20]|uniref:SDR family oxidoreductase n=1 Tax=Paludibacillus litoralis TaxID=3133267 RepID=UPI0030ECEFDC